MGFCTHRARDTEKCCADEDAAAAKKKAKKKKKARKEKLEADRDGEEVCDLVWKILYIHCESSYTVYGYPQWISCVEDLVGGTCPTLGR